MNAADEWLTDSRIVRRVSVSGEREIDTQVWPATIPAVRALIDEGFDLGPGVTFLVGENGSGKSTIIEAIAAAVGLPAEGGTLNGGQTTRPSESSLSEWLDVERGLQRHGAWGFFLRAETMHGYYSYLESLPGSPDSDLHEFSHGESFLEILDRKATRRGFYVLDEPEAALSFTSTLSCLRSLSVLADNGSQVLCATHSPILASLPGARILELGEWGIRESSWDDLQVVGEWRSYLAAPERYLNPLLE